MWVCVGQRITLGVVRRCPLSSVELTKQARLTGRPVSARGHLSALPALGGHMYGSP